MDLVRCIIKPEFAEEGGKKIPITAIPVQLFDMHLGKFVEFNPDCECSKDYADALIKTNGRFEIIGKNAKVTKENYVIRKDYRKPEFDNHFNNLTPDEKDVVLEFMDMMVKGKEEKEEGFVDKWLAKVKSLWNEEDDDDSDLWDELAEKSRLLEEAQKKIEELTKANPDKPGKDTVKDGKTDNSVPDKKAN